MAIKMVQTSKYITKAYIGDVLVGIIKVRNRVNHTAAKFYPSTHSEPAQIFDSHTAAINWLIGKCKEYEEAIIEGTNTSYNPTNWGGKKQRRRKEPYYGTPSS